MLELLFYLETLHCAFDRLWKRIVFGQQKHMLKKDATVLGLDVICDFDCRSKAAECLIGLCVHALTELQQAPGAAEEQDLVRKGGTASLPNSWVRRASPWTPPVVRGPAAT